MPDSSRAPTFASGRPSSSTGELPAGGFRFWFVGQRWEWSDEVARMHGYEPGTVSPTTELLLSHKHPDDRRHVQELLDHALHFGGSFNSKHRFLDTRGVEHDVLVIADRIYDRDGAVVGTEGYYVDLTETLDRERRAALDESLPDLFAARAAIEQDAAHCGDLRKELRALAAQLVAELHTAAVDNAGLRRHFDHLMLTVHERVDTSPQRR